MSFRQGKISGDTIVAMLKCDDEDGCCGSFGDCLVKKAEAGQFAGPVAQGNA